MSHLDQHHPGLLLGLRLVYAELIMDLNELTIPCGLCRATWHPRKPANIENRLHTCPVVMNLALAKLYFDSALATMGRLYSIPPADDAHMRDGPSMIPVEQIVASSDPDPLGAFLDALMR